MSLDEQGLKRPMASASTVHGDCLVTFTQALPAEPLRPYISGYQFVELTGPPGAEITDYAYPSWANLRLLFDGEDWSVAIGARIYEPAERLVLFGPLSHAARITCKTPCRRVAVGVTPLGWARLFRRDASAYADRLTPLGDLIGADADLTAEALAARPEPEPAFEVLDALLAPRLAASTPPSIEVQRMHDLIMSDEMIEVSDFAERLGMSTRHAARLCAEVFGFAPKLLFRRRRFLRTLNALREPGDTPWRSRLDASYHDQPQFSRDFRAFMGMSPSEFFARPRPMMEASHCARAAVLGVGIQGLQPPIRGSAG